MGLSKTHFFGHGEADGSTVNECKVWEGLKGGVVWVGLNKCFGGKVRKNVQSLSRNEYGRVCVRLRAEIFCGYVYTESVYSYKKLFLKKILVAISTKIKISSVR